MNHTAEMKILHNLFNSTAADKRGKMLIL